MDYLQLLNKYKFNKLFMKKSVWIILRFLWIIFPFPVKMYIRQKNPVYWTGGFHILHLSGKEFICLLKITVSALLRDFPWWGFAI